MIREPLRIEGFYTARIVARRTAQLALLTTAVIATLAVCGAAVLVVSVTVVALGELRSCSAKTACFTATQSSFGRNH
jgi:hypothetical protein